MAFSNPYYAPKPAPQMPNLNTVPSTAALNPPAPQPDFAQLANRNAQSYKPPTGNSSLSANSAVNAVGGAVSIASNAINMANQGLNLNTNVAPIQYDQSMKPTYTAGQLSADAARAKPQGATWEEVLSSAGTGAATGASIGGVWGGVIGGVVGAGASLIGGGSRQSKQRKEKRRALGKANAAGQQYNQADIAFRDRTARMEDYNEKNNMNNRLYNLYRANY